MTMKIRASIFQLILITTVLPIQSSANDGSGKHKNIAQQFLKSCRLYTRAGFIQLPIFQVLFSHSS